MGMITCPIANLYDPQNIKEGIILVAGFKSLKNDVKKFGICLED
jgi:hypothetical protein